MSQPGTPRCRAATRAPDTRHIRPASPTQKTGAALGVASPAVRPLIGRPLAALPAARGGSAFYPALPAVSEPFPHA